MTNGQKHEYFLLQYAPSAVKERTINIGLVLFESTEVPGAFCRAKFGRNWQASVLRIDPNADIEVLEALMRDIDVRLAAADSREEMLGLMESSFSGVVRVSDRRSCQTHDPLRELERLALRHL